MRVPMRKEARTQTQGRTRKPLCVLCGGLTDRLVTARLGVHSACEDLPFFVAANRSSEVVDNPLPTRGQTVGSR